MRICIIRHGETNWNNEKKIQGRENIPLNQNGINQVKDTINYLKKHNWKFIITSPLSRARISAEIISSEIGNIEIIKELDFVERDFGNISGLTINEANKLFPDGIWKGIESSETLQNRAVSSLKKYIKLCDGENIIIVSHGGTINSILSFLSNNEIGTGKTSLENACITLLEKNGEQINIVFFNKKASELI